MPSLEMLLQRLADQDAPLALDDVIATIDLRLSGGDAPPHSISPDGIDTVSLEVGRNVSGRTRGFRAAWAFVIAVVVTIVVVGLAGILARSNPETPPADTVPLSTSTLPGTSPVTTGPTGPPPTPSMPVVPSPTTMPGTPTSPASDPIGAGLTCTDLQQLGLPYEATLAYWVREGLPDRMDPDRDRIPCNTLYPAEQVDAVLHWEQPEPTDPGGSGDGGPLGSGMLCADIRDLGIAFRHALAYWVREGVPERMDADRNGLPCETIYPWAEIEATLAFDGTAVYSPQALGSEWTANTELTSGVNAACCGTNATGPTSPPLPPGSGVYPDDGVYVATVSRHDGQYDALAVTLRRYVLCAEAPDQCLDPQPGDITGDPSTWIDVRLPLDDTLTVVVSPIYFESGSGLIGSGSAFADLLRAFDAAYDEWILPPGSDRPTRRSCASECPFVTLWNSGAVGYRGPRGTYLVLLPELDQWLEEGWPRGPNGLYGWETVLAIRDGRPVLFIGADRIAG